MPVSLHIWACLWRCVQISFPVPCQTFIHLSSSTVQSSNLPRTWILWSGVGWGLVYFAFAPWSDSKKGHPINRRFSIKIFVITGSPSGSYFVTFFGTRLRSSSSWNLFLLFSITDSYLHLSGFCGLVWNTPTFNINTNIQSPFKNKINKLALVWTFPLIPPVTEFPATTGSTSSLHFTLRAIIACENQASFWPGQGYSDQISTLQWTLEHG